MSVTFRDWVGGQYRIIKVARGDRVCVVDKISPRRRIKTVFTFDGQVVRMRVSHLDISDAGIRRIMGVYDCARDRLQSELAADSKGRTINAFKRPKWTAALETIQDRIRY